MSRRGDDEGAAAVEMAVMMPLLLLILLGILDFGLLFMNNIAITNAAHEGSRILSLGATTSVVNARVATASGISPDSISITNCSSGGGDATVTVIYTHNFQFISMFGLNAKTLSATAVEKCA